MIRRRHAWILAAALATAACDGLITDPNSPGGGGSGGDGGDDGGETVTDDPRGVCEDDAANKPGPRLLRRLTGAEVDATVRAALRLDAVAWQGAQLPADGAARNGFTNNADRLVVDETYAARLRSAANDVGALVASAPYLSQVSPCSPVGDRACAESYLDTVGRRLFRRPLTADERARYLALYDKVMASADFPTWVQWATSGMIQSPNFIYRTELGEPDGGQFRLTDYEIAAALAYNLTGAPPDDALLDLAASGALSTPAGIEAAARDLVVDATGAVKPAARAVFLEFSNRWLGLSALANIDKSAELFPDFSPAVRDSMQRETDAFISHVVFDQRGGWADLLTAPVTFVDQTLAAYYGFGLAGFEPTLVERPAGWGVGLLAQGSLLAVNAGNTHTSPTQRGLVVRERMLCFDPPPPPPTVGDLPEPTGNETTRERYEDVHAGNPVCAGCHKMFDPIGFAFEHLDASARFRDTENGLAIDDSGYVTALADEDLVFSGPTELAILLSERPEPAACMASYMASYAYGLDHHDTSCLVSDLADELAAGNAGIFDAWLRLASTPHFTTRTAE